MKNITFSDRLRYWFDNTMSKGPVAMIGLLFAMSALLIIFVSALITLFGLDRSEDGSRIGFIQITWMSLMRTLDAGTMGGDSGSWPFLFAMFIVTLGGVFIVSTLIGILSSGIEGKIEELRKGRSFVVEEDHTVILGWSTQVFSIVTELVTANANRKRACIAILAHKDKIEMEDELKSRIPNLKNTRLVCRTGSTIDLADLEIVNLHASRAIIILAPETEDADTQTIKTILAITNNPNRRTQPYHITAEIRDPDNLEAARLVGKHEVELIKVDELISRITAQTCRQSGLSVVYTELLDFGGDEIYFKEEPSLVGKPFGDALLAYATSSVIGLQLKDGRVQLLPPMESRIQAGDRVIAISEDDDTLVLSSSPDLHISDSLIRNQNGRQNGPENTLILGCNRRTPLIVKELDHYVAPGSHVIIASPDAGLQTRLKSECGTMKNQILTFEVADTTKRRVLDSLNPLSFDHVISLSASDLHDAQQADARSMITLLHLRDIADQHDHPFSIVSEMLDVRNRELAEVCRADDFIVSDKLVSLMMSQIAENKALAPVFEDLFDPEGAELYLKPCDNYIVLGQPVNFYTIVEAARRRGEIAIGYRLKSESGNPEASYGVHVNPNKSLLITFTPGDKIIALAES